MSLQHKIIHPLSENSIRNGGRFPAKEERHSSDNPESMEGSSAETKILEDEALSYNYAEVYKTMAGEERSNETEKGGVGYQKVCGGFYHEKWPSHGHQRRLH